MSSSRPVTVATDAGMLALWCAAAFDGVDGYADWEERVDDRLGMLLSGANSCLSASRPTERSVFDLPLHLMAPRIGNLDSRL